VSLALPATTYARGSAYVVSTPPGGTVDTPGDVSQFAIGAGGQLSALSPPTITAGRLPGYLAVTPNGKSVYVSNFLDDTISQYNVDPSTGALSPKNPATIESGNSPAFGGAAGVAVTPDGTTAYVVNSADNLVWMYNIDPATGKLSPKTPAGVPTSGGPQSIVVSPDGHNAYVTDQVGPTGSVSYTSGAVSQYTITPGTDVLVPKAPPTVDAGQQPQGLAVTPDGASLYVANYGIMDPQTFQHVDASISQYTIVPGTGNLVPKVPASAPLPPDDPSSPTLPNQIAVTPDGNYAYAAIGRTLVQYKISGGSGNLSLNSPATVGGGPDNVVAVSPDGASAYTQAAGNAVAEYSIDSTTGTLSPKSPASVGTSAGGPVAIAFGSLPRSCSGSNANCH